MTLFTVCDITLKSIDSLCEIIDGFLQAFKVSVSLSMRFDLFSIGRNYALSHVWRVIMMTGTQNRSNLLTTLSFISRILREPRSNAKMLILLWESCCANLQVLGLLTWMMRVGIGSVMLTIRSCTLTSSERIAHILQIIVAPIETLFFFTVLRECRMWLLQMLSPSCGTHRFSCYKR